MDRKLEVISYRANPLRVDTEIGRSMGTHAINFVYHLPTAPVWYSAQFGFKDEQNNPTRTHSLLLVYGFDGRPPQYESLDMSKVDKENDGVELHETLDEAVDRIGGWDALPEEVAKNLTNLETHYRLCSRLIA